MYEVKSELLRLIQKAISAGEKGAEILVDKVPQVAEGYLSYIIWWNVLAVMAQAVLASIAIYITVVSIKSWKKKNDFNDVCAVTIPSVTMGVISVLTLGSLFSSGVARLKMIFHATLSPVTAIYEYLIKPLQ